MTLLHYDLCHGILIQIGGNKGFTYFPPDNFPCLYEDPLCPELSQINVGLFPESSSESKLYRTKFNDVKPVQAVVEPGYLIYTAHYCGIVFNRKGQFESCSSTFLSGNFEGPHICHWI